MHYRLALYIVLVATLFAGLVYTDSNVGASSSVFMCPPCGCSADHQHFSEAGTCSVCDMKLIEVTPSQNLVSLTSSMLQDDSSNFYLKFVYPSFIVGIILGLLSLVRMKGKTLNPFLGGLILVLALYGFKNQLYGVSYGFSDNFRLLFVPISFILLLGPLLFFYTRSVTDGSLKVSAKDMLHFVPALIFFLFYLIPLLSSDDLKRSLMLSPYETSFSHAEQFITVVSLFAYLYVSWEITGSWDRGDNHKIEFRWLSRFLVGVLVFSLVWFLLIIVNFELYDMGVATLTYNPLWVLSSLLIYWILIEVMVNPRHFFVYALAPGSNGPSAKVEKTKQLLLQVMEAEKPYLDPFLTLDKLAGLLETNPKHLSAVINNGFNKNFYEFVNAYRIQEVKKLLQAPDYKHLTIAAIANEAGFNSKSTFNAIFKKHTNLTPKEFLRQFSS